MNTHPDPQQARVQHMKLDNENPYMEIVLSSNTTDLRASQCFNKCLYIVKNQPMFNWLSLKLIIISTYTGSYLNRYEFTSQIHILPHKICKWTSLSINTDIIHAMVYTTTSKISITIQSITSIYETILLIETLCTYKLIVCWKGRVWSPRKLVCRENYKGVLSKFIFKNRRHS